MAKGTQAKSEVVKKILSTFEGSFIYNDGKEVRIPIYEAGELVQIKVTLTCAKENVTPGADNAMPGDFPVSKNAEPTPERTEPVKPTSEEKANIAALLKNLGL